MTTIYWGDKRTLFFLKIVSHGLSSNRPHINTLSARCPRHAKSRYAPRLQLILQALIPWLSNFVSLRQKVHWQSKDLVEFTPSDSAGLTAVWKEVTFASTTSVEIYSPLLIYLDVDRNELAHRRRPHFACCDISIVPHNQPEVTTAFRSEHVTKVRNEAS